MGNDSAAFREMELAIRLDPANPWNYAYLAEVYDGLGRFEAAVGALRQAVAIEPDNVNWQMDLALDLERAGRTTESLALLARLCEGAHRLGPCTLYARGLLNAGRRNEALPVARKAGGLEGAWRDYYDLACFWAVAVQARPPH